MRSRPAPWVEFVQAPLVPFTIAATLGLISDRYLAGSVDFGLAVAAASIAGWWKLRTLGCLWLAAFGLAHAYHHWHRNEFPPNDIGRYATADVRVVKVRGVVAEDPITRKPFAPDSIQPQRQKVYDSTTLDTTSMETATGTWAAVSGRLRLRVERDAEGSAPLFGIRPGDVVEVIGQLSQPQALGNPGERDPQERLLDQRLRGDLRSTGSAGITRLDHGEWNITRGLATLRGFGVRTIETSLPANRTAVARALLLGDGSAMERSEWDAYIRTGVVHVLAISGQHLVLLAAFAWFALGSLGIPRRNAAWIVAGLVFTYAALTGLRPSALRAAIMVAAVGGAIVLRRPVSVANAFAAAWLGVIALNPCDAFDLGGRLSFISVFVLVWGIGKYLQPAPPGLEEQLINSSRPQWLRWLRGIIRTIGMAYLVNLLLFAANTPLLIAEQNLASPVALLVGPVLVVLTSIALIAGFLMFLTAPIPGSGELLGGFVQLSLGSADAVVSWAGNIPGGAIYLPGLPMAWLVGFYALVATIVLLGWENSRQWQWVLCIWIAAGFVWPYGTRPGEGELRLTYLALGHGGCTVLETEDGRCFLYDTGAVTGPDVVRRVIAPYLWYRGIRKVDEVFLSHADADHFNGVSELLRRFPVGRITVTPSFAEKPTADVAEMLHAVKSSGIEMRAVVAGQKFEAGKIAFEVLHPPLKGPGNSENERSLVMVVRHAGHTLLFTGDLEKSGTAMLMLSPPVEADVMQAPHHGSQAAFPKSLAKWANPKFVIANRGGLYSNFIREGHAGLLAPIWDTHTCGAITLRSHRSGLTAEAFRTKERIVIVRGGQ